MQPLRVRGAYMRPQEWHIPRIASRNIEQNKTHVLGIDDAISIAFQYTFFSKRITIDGKELFLGHAIDIKKIRSQKSYSESYCTVNMCTTHCD